MNLFKKLFGGKATEEVKYNSSEFKTFKKGKYSSLQEMIEQNAGLSFEKQMVFGEIIGSNAWQFDMTKGNITFGNLSFPVQVIGSLAFNNYSWMWAWANEKSGIPENLLKQSRDLKRIGDATKIKELVEGHFPVEEGFEHKVGLMSCGIFNAKSYYCANYGQGTLVVTIDDDKVPKIDTDKVEKVLTSFPQLISSNVELNHKSAFLNYLIDREFKVNMKDDEIEGLRNDKLIIAKFDESGRLKNLNGKL